LRKTVKAKRAKKKKSRENIGNLTENHPSARR